MDWSRTYSAHWHVRRVDSATWADGERIGGIDSVSVKRDATGSAPLVDSGSMRATGEPVGSGYYQVVMEAVQDGAVERAEVATLLCEATGGTTDHGVTSYELLGRSVLWPAAAYTLPYGSYAPAGVDGAAHVASLLRRRVAAPVTVDEGAGFRLARTIVHEPGATALDAVWEVLRAGGHTIRVHGDGTVHVMPEPTEPVLTIDASTASMVRTGIGATRDLSGVPNVLVVIDGDVSVTATNDDPDSPTGLQARGYEYRVVEDGPTLAEGESLAAYARRRLRELSTIESTRTYKRKWCPDVYPGDVVRGSVASEGLDGDMRITSQSLEVGAAVTVSETAAMEVTTWSG